MSYATKKMSASIKNLVKPEAVHAQGKAEFTNCPRLASLDSELANKLVAAKVSFGGCSNVSFSINYQEHFGVLVQNGAFDLGLYPEPFELDGDELVAGHDGVGCLMPFGGLKWTTNLSLHENKEKQELTKKTH